MNLSGWKWGPCLKGSCFHASNEKLRDSPDLCVSKYIKPSPQDLSTYLCLSQSNICLGSSTEIYDKRYHAHGNTWFTFESVLHQRLVLLISHNNLYFPVSFPVINLKSLCMFYNCIKMFPKYKKPSRAVICLTLVLVSIHKPTVTSPNRPCNCRWRKRHFWLHSNIIKISQLKGE